MSNILKGILNEVSPHNYDSDWDYQDAVARSGKSRSSYRSREDDTSDADIAYSKKMYQLSQKQKRDADHGRLASGTNEGTGLDIDRSIPGRTIARISGTSPDPEIGKLRRNPHAKKLPDFYDDNDYDQWSGKVGPSIHDDEEDTFHTDYTGDEEGELKEISNEKLAKYKTAAALDAGKADKEGDYKRGDKRFSGIVKATKKQFANDTKKSNISQGMAEADEKPAEPFKTGYPRVNNPKILGTQNRAKSIYHPPSKPNVKKLDKPLPENLGNELKSKSLEALQQVKQQLEKQRMADLEQWENDFKQNTVAKFTARQPSFMRQEPTQVAQPKEKHSVLKARLVQLDNAIQKQAVLDKMLQRLDSKGLLTPAMQADTDTSMLVRDGAKDNYVSLNQKLDKALELIKTRLMTNKAAFSKSKTLDENEELDENLHKWFQEKWVRFGPDGKIRGDCARGDDSEGKPKCLPQSKAHSLGKKGRASAASRKRREDPNPERSGKAINVNTKKTNEEQLDELSCWSGYHRVAGTKAGFPGSCAKNKTNESEHSCPHCGGEMVSEELMNEKKDACYYKVKSRYKVWPSAYASGALVKCRKKGASNWGTGGKKNESIEEDQLDEKWTKKYKDSINCSNPKGFSQKAHCAGKQKNESSIMQGLNQIDEGWKEKLGAAALTGAMALGAAGANARVTPGDDPNINRLTGKPNVTQPVQAQTPTKAEAPKGFSKEYLQSVANGTHPRPMISVEKAQELLKQGQ